MLKQHDLDSVSQVAESRRKPSTALDRMRRDADSTFEELKEAFIKHAGDGGLKTNRMSAIAATWGVSIIEAVAKEHVTSQLAPILEAHGTEKAVSEALHELCRLAQSSPNRAAFWQAVCEARAALYAAFAEEFGDDPCEPLVLV